MKTNRPIPIHATCEKIFPIDSLRHQWNKFECFYQAQGGERFIVLGNFIGDMKYEYKREADLLGLSPMLSASSYCYLDDVSVEESNVILPIQKPKTPYFNPKSVRINTVYQLRFVYFDYDKSDLQQEAFPELDDVARVLIRQPSWHLELSGHTDDQGKDNYNLPLSERRARSVGDYLQQNGGIDTTRMSYHGFGQSRPLESDTTEEARSKNRRVEIRFIANSIE